MTIIAAITNRAGGLECVRPATWIVADATIGDFTGVNKQGWEYLWFLFEDVEDQAEKKVVRRPRSAYVEQINRTAAFSGLGI
jgi:hypothetical protein